MRITERQLRGLIKEALTQAQRATAAYAAERRHEWPSVQDYEADPLQKAQASEWPAAQDIERVEGDLASQIRGLHDDWQPQTEEGQLYKDQLGELLR